MVVSCPLSPLPEPRKDEPEKLGRRILSRFELHYAMLYVSLALTIVFAFSNYPHIKSAPIIEYLTIFLWLQHSKE